MAQCSWDEKIAASSKAILDIDCSERRQNPAHEQEMYRSL